jgi:hypothetical protein
MPIQSLIVGLIWVVLAIVVIGVVYWALAKMAAAGGAPPIVTTGLQVIAGLLCLLVVVYWLVNVLPPWKP